MALYKNFKEFHDIAKKICIDEGNVCDQLAQKIINGKTEGDLINLAIEKIHNLRWVFEKGWYRVAVFERLNPLFLNRHKIVLNKNCKEGYALADKGVVTISGNVLAFVYGDVQVIATEKARIMAYENANVVAKESSTVHLFDDSVVNACDDSRIFKFGNNPVVGKDRVTILAPSKEGITLTYSSKFRKLPKNQIR